MASMLEEHMRDQDREVRRLQQECIDLTLENSVQAEEITRLKILLESAELHLHNMSAK